MKKAVKDSISQEPPRASVTASKGKKARNTGKSSKRVLSSDRPRATLSELRAAAKSKELSKNEDLPPHLIVEARAGCLAADTIINVNRAGKGSKMTIEKLVKQLSGNPPVYTRKDNGVESKMKLWDLSIDTYVARAEGEVIKLAKVVNAWYSGNKETFTVTTDSGRQIRATTIHPFLTASGEWLQLGQLTVGQEIQVNSGQGGRGRNAKFQYRYRTTKYHPNQIHNGGGRYKVATHRMTVEAEMNGMELEEFVTAVRTNNGRSSTLSYLDRDQIVHHIDGDTSNNHLSNLEVLSNIKEHSDQHDWGSNVLYQVGTEKVISIERYGIEPTYDIEVEDDPHNFLANGFVVHNTGKTTTLIEGLKCVMGNSKPSIVPSVQQQAIWDSMMLSRGRASTILFCAFNKAIANELQDRVPAGCNASTMHSLGFRAVGTAWDLLPKKAVNNWKVREIISELKGVDSRDLLKEKPTLIIATERLVELCKMNLTDPDVDELDWLSSHYDVEMNGERAEVYDLVPQVLELCLDVQRYRYIDFADMIWLPVVHDLPIAKYDLLLVDESQDLNHCQQELALKAGRRLICVGDPKQCHPAGTMVKLTGGGELPIEKIEVGMNLITYNTKTSTKFTGKRTQGRRVEKKASRRYQGLMYRINGCGSTPNHRWLTRLKSDIGKNVYATYLCELEDGTFRIGMSQLQYEHGFGPSYRARQRKATKMWLLGVYKSKMEARREELIDSYTYRVVQVNDNEIIDHNWVNSIDSDVNGLLAKYKRCIEFPLWDTESNDHIGKYSYMTRACNLIHGYNEVCEWVDGNPVWKPLDLIFYHYYGVVYSLQVEPTEGGRRLYIANDVVTGNSIYGFAGADSKSMDTMFKKLASQPNGCDLLPLTVTRRCGQSIVHKANEIVSDFEAHESNGPGRVYTSGFAEYRKNVRPGDMVLCRVNAPLVSECFKFLKAGKLAQIQGRDIGSGLVKLVEKMKAGSIEGLLNRLNEWYHSEVKKENSKKHPSEARLIALSDKFDCLMCFVHRTEPSKKEVTVADVISRIESIFTNDRTRKAILLSSGHKAKGLEAERVFILQPKSGRCPHPMAKTAWQIGQEYNLLYVMITRAIKELCIVEEEDD